MIEYSSIDQVPSDIRAISTPVTSDNGISNYSSLDQVPDEIKKISTPIDNNEIPNYSSVDDVPKELRDISTPVLNGEQPGILKRLVYGTGRGIAAGIEQAGGVTQLTAQSIRSIGEFTGHISEGGKVSEDPLYKAGGWLYDQGNKLYQMLPKGETGNQKFTEGGWYQPGWYLDNATEAISQIAIPLGAGLITKNPLMFTLIGGAQVAGSTYEEAYADHVKSGMDQEQASKTAAAEASLTGLVAGMLFKIPEMEFFDKGILSNTIRKVVSNRILSEGAAGATGLGLAQTLQAVSGDLIAQGYRFDENRFNDWVNKYATTATLGVITGGVVGSVKGAIEQSNIKYVEQVKKQMEGALEEYTKNVEQSPQTATEVLKGQQEDLGLAVPLDQLKEPTPITEQPKVQNVPQEPTSNQDTVKSSTIEPNKIEPDLASQGIVSPKVAEPLVVPRVEDLNKPTTSEPPVIDNAKLAEIGDRLKNGETVTHIDGYPIDEVDIAPNIDLKNDFVFKRNPDTGLNEVKQVRYDSWGKNTRVKNAEGKNIIDLVYEPPLSKDISFDRKTRQRVGEDPVILYQSDRSEETKIKNQLSNLKSIGVISEGVPEAKINTKDISGLPDNERVIAYNIINELEQRFKEDFAKYPGLLNAVESLVYNKSAEAHAIREGKIPSNFRIVDDKGFTAFIKGHLVDQYKSLMHLDEIQKTSQASVPTTSLEAMQGRQETVHDTFQQMEGDQTSREAAQQSTTDAINKAMEKLTPSEKNIVDQALEAGNISDIPVDIQRKLRENYEPTSNRPIAARKIIIAKENLDPEEINISMANSREKAKSLDQRRTRSGDNVPDGSLLNDASNVSAKTDNAIGAIQDFNSARERSPGISTLRVQEKEWKEKIRGIEADPYESTRTNQERINHFSGLVDKISSLFKDLSLDKPIFIGENETHITVDGKKIKLGDDAAFAIKDKIFINVKNIHYKGAELSDLGLHIILDEEIEHSLLWRAMGLNDKGIEFINKYIPNESKGIIFRDGNKIYNLRDIIDQIYPDSSHIELPYEIIRILRQMVRLGFTTESLTQTSNPKILDGIRILKDNINTVMEQVWKSPYLKILMRAPDSQFEVVDSKTGEVISAKAYHGTPYDFDKFSLEKIGQGEGHQAYGWGLYFTDVHDIAKYYKKTISRSLIEKEAGENLKNLSKKDSTILEDVFNDIPYLSEEYDRYDTYGNNLRLYSALEYIYNSKDDSSLYEFKNRLIKAGFKSIEAGIIYKADIPEPSQMLDWDKRNQSESVQRGIDKYISDNNLTNVIKDFENQFGKSFHEWTGKDIYNFISDIEARKNPGISGEAMAEENASKVLNEYGINGIKYLTGLARGGNGDSSNYVVFDDQAIKILEKNGQPLAVKAKKINMGSEMREKEPSALDNLLAWGKTLTQERFTHRVSDNQISVDKWERIYNQLITGSKNLLNDAMSAYKTIIRSTEAEKIALNQILPTGQPIWKDGTWSVKEGTKGLTKIFDDVYQQLGIKGLRDLKWYLGGLRADELMKVGKETLFTKDRIKELLSLRTEENGAIFDQAVKEYHEYVDSVMDFMEKTQLLSPALRTKLHTIYKDYVPFYRVMDEFSQERYKGIGPKSSKAVAEQSHGIRSITGSDKQLNDLFDNIQRNMVHGIAAGIRNMAMLKFIAICEGIKQAGGTSPLERVSGGRLANIPLSEIKSELVSRGVDPKSLEGLPDNEIANLWNVGHRPKGDNIVSVAVEGKRQYYKVNDQLLYESLSLISRRPYVDLIPGVDILKPFRAAKRLLQIGVTLTPAFQERNLIKDGLTAFFQNKGVNTPLVALEGARALLRNDPRIRQLMIAGAGDPSIFHDPYSRLSEMEGRRSDGVIGKLVRAPHDLILLGEKISSVSEMATRLGVALRAMDKGMSVSEAAWLYRTSTTDFGLQGSSKIIQVLNEIVPFFNASIQGITRSVGAARENPKDFAIKALPIMLASAALAIKNNDDERYNRLEDWKKAAAWHNFVSIDGVDYDFMIPKPFDVPYIIANSPEWFTSTFLKSIKGDFDQFDYEAVKSRMLSDIWKTFAVNPLDVQLIKPAAEWAMNKDFFRGQNIVPYGMENLPPAMQYNVSTSSLAKVLGSATGTSPMQLEHLLGAYTGQLGSYWLAVSNGVYNTITGQPSSPSRSWISWAPYINNMVSRTDEQRGKYLGQFYQMTQETEALSRQIKMTIEEGRVEDAMKIYEKDPGVMSRRNVLNSIHNSIDQLNKFNKAVYLDGTMDGNKKAEIVKDISRQKEELSKMALEITKPIRNP